jgi:ornithine carbamoyltransferase
MVKRHFLRLSDISLEQCAEMFQRARQLKQRRREHLLDNTLAGRTLVLIFEKPSTRTRLSFEAAMFQLGGCALTLNAGDSQMGRGETIADTARVVSRYADAIMLRTFGDDRLQQFAAAATVPVINGLSDGGHPVQLLADLFTVEERLGSVKDRTVAFIGDGTSNMARSWAEAARLFGFALRIGAPPSYRLPDDEARGAKVQVTANPSEAVLGADVVATDVWTSMGQEAEAQKRRRELRGFCVDEALVAKAKPECIVLHCLPAHRGEEISDRVIDGPKSAVFDEAENRLHVQKALLEQLILG